jgi:hypothetical protein
MWQSGWTTWGSWPVSVGSLADNVTINVYRPGTVDTSMQEWLRTQDPARVGEQIHTPENAGQALVAHLSGEGTGQIWDVSDAL